MCMFRTLGCDNGRRWRSYRNAEFRVQRKVRLHGHPSQSGPPTAPQRQWFTGRRDRRNRLRIANVRDTVFVIPPSGQGVSTASRRLPSSHAWPVTTSPSPAITDRYHWRRLHVVQPVGPGNSNNC